MLPPKIKLPPEQQRLLKLYRQLAKSEQNSLLDYAEFLLQRGDGTNTESASQAVPEDIQRPESETVVAAMRRLSQTFHMLDKDVLLHEASDLMSAHIMQGRPAAEVIDELERIFRHHYDRKRSPSEEETR